jgi:hypothetical protein
MSFLLVPVELAERMEDEAPVGLFGRGCLDAHHVPP